MSEKSDKVIEEMKEYVEKKSGMPLEKMPGIIIDYDKLKNHYKEAIYIFSKYIQYLELCNEILEKRVVNDNN